MKKWLAKSLITALLGLSVTSFAVAESNTDASDATTTTQMNGATGTDSTMTTTTPSATDATTTVTTPATTTDTTATTTTTTTMDAAEKKHEGNGKHHKMSKSEIMMMPAADVKWVEPPASAGFSQGIQIAYLDQHNLRSGAPFAFLVKIPANNKEMPHYHPTKMQGVIMSGTYYLGTGKSFDESKGTPLPAGSFFTVPAKKSYYGWTQDETIVLVHSMGPWSTRMVNGEKADKHHKNGNGHSSEKNEMTNGNNMTTQPAAGTDSTTTPTGSSY